MSKYLPLFRKYIPSLDGDESKVELLGSCPFPGCGRRKFYVNSQTGQYHCKVCGASGNAISFARFFGENPRPYYDIPPVSTTLDLSRIAEYRQNLIQRPEIWPKPWKQHVIELLQVGWDEKRKVFTFPIFDSSGTINNLIYHKLCQNKGARCSLHPAHLLEVYDPSYVILCEGLTDLVTLHSIDIQAVTSTGGATSIPKDISVLRRFKRVYLCFDIDKAGESGCDMWITRLLSEMNR